MSHRHLIAAALLLIAPAPTAAQSVKAGIEAWQRADYSGAVAIWRPLAEKGDPDAQFNLGQAYRLGRGVPTDLAVAKTWFERAANQGHLDAETTLGLLLFQNGEQSDGLKWLKQAAEKGEPRAQLVYGTALVNGDSVTQDPVLGYAYVSRAAAQGLEPAKQTLAQLNQILSPEDRRKGQAVAETKPVALPPTPTTAEPALKPAKPTQVAEKPAAKPVKTAEVAEKPAPKPEKVARTKPAPKPVQTASATPPEKPAAQAPAKQAPKAEPTGDWRIQLGAFSKKGSAEALYGKLSGKAALSGRHAYYVAAGPVTRLQVGPFASKAAAEAACKAVGIACFPVAAK
jgi:cell division protein FtsN